MQGPNFRILVSMPRTAASAINDRAARTPKLGRGKTQRVSSRASEASRGIPFARANGSLDSLRSLGMTRLRKDSGISYRGAASRIRALQLHRRVRAVAQQFGLK